MAKHADGPKQGTTVLFNPHAVDTVPGDWKPSGNYNATHGDTAERPFPLPGRVERKSKRRKRTKPSQNSD